MDLNTLEYADLPLVLTFHESVWRDFEIKINAARGAPPADDPDGEPQPDATAIFRLACDLANLESASNRNAQMNEPVPVVVNEAGERRMTTHARDVNRAQVLALAMLAVEKFHVSAAYMAGWMTYIGRGCDQDKKLGEKLVRMAAEAGHAGAMEHLRTVVGAPPSSHQPCYDETPTVFLREDQQQAKKNTAAVAAPRCALRLVVG